MPLFMIVYQTWMDTPSLETRKSARVAVFNNRGHVRSLAAIERDVIYFALTYYSGNVTEVASRLGIGRSTLYRKMSEAGLIPGAAPQND